MYCITRLPRASRIQSGLPSASSLVKVTYFSSPCAPWLFTYLLCATLMTSRPRLSRMRHARAYSHVSWPSQAARCSRLITVGCAGVWRAAVFTTGFRARCRGVVSRHEPGRKFHPAERPVRHFRPNQYARQRHNKERRHAHLAAGSSQSNRWSPMNAGSYCLTGLPLLFKTVRPLMIQRSAPPRGFRFCLNLFHQHIAGTVGTFQGDLQASWRCRWAGKHGFSLEDAGASRA